MNFTFQELKNGVRAQAGIATSDITAGEWVNAKYGEMCARAEWNMQEVLLGVTVANQERYPLPDTVVDLGALLVDGTPYDRVATKTLFDIKAGKLRLSNSSAGAFAPSFSSEGGEQLSLYPAPSAADQEITGLVSAEATPMVAPDAVPIVPRHLREYIRDGAIGQGLALIDERLDSAAWFNDRFEFGIELLARWKNSRVGGGPVRAKLAGVHFS